MKRCTWITSSVEQLKNREIILCNKGFSGEGSLCSTHRAAARRQEMEEEEIEYRFKPEEVKE
jgi:hypothetical protein